MNKSLTTLALCMLISIASAFSQPFKDLIPGPHPASSTPDQFINVGTKMFFVTAVSPGGAANHQLWVTDGTVSGTILVKDSLIITTLTSPVVPQVDVNGILYFTVGGVGCSTCDVELWKSDGTPGGTVFVDTLSITGGAIPKHFVALGSNCVFSMGNANGRELWISDGTAAGTTEIIDLSPGSNGGVEDSKMITYNNKVYFKGTTALGNQELYASDGTAAGTTLVKEINPSTFPSGDSSPKNWIIYNSELYFNADNGSDWGLWKSDGTAAGTVQVYAPCDFGGPVIFNGEIYFLGWNVSGGFTNPLWKSDGTTAGTMMVRDSMGSIYGMNSSYIMTSYWGGTSTIYKRCDGTAAGVTQVPYNTGMSGSFAVLGNDMYASHLDSGTTNIGVWKTDGTVAGTSMVLAGFGTGPVHKYNNAIWFSNFESGTGYELWTLNGPAGLGELIEENNLHIYPNPATENLNVEISDFTSGTIELINMSGSIISSQQFNHSTMILHIGDLIPGIYMVRVTTQEGTSVQKLIKN